MQRYQHFVDWVRLLALFTAVFVADLFLRQLEHYHVSSMLIALLLGISVIVCLHIAELVAVRLAEDISWIKRWLLGPEWIEGVWFDEVIGQDHFALLSISLVEGTINVRGEQFDTRGTVTATWESTASAKDGNTLVTLYRSPQFLDNQLRETTGMSTYIFHGEPGQPPDFYSGFFIDSAESGRRCQLSGFRVKDAPVVRRLMDTHARRAEILSLIRRMQENAPPGLQSAP